MREPTDEELVGLTKTCDRQACGLLVARYQGHVYGLAYSMVDNWAAAQVAGAPLRVVLPPSHRSDIARSVHMLIPVCRATSRNTMRGARRARGFLAGVESAH